MSALRMMQGLMASGALPYLDQLTPTPLVAYGVRRLTSTATIAIRVRRSSDNAEQDIGFTGDALDTAALAAFVGSNNAFVTRFYNQAGAGLDLAHATASAQPRIVNAGTYDGSAVFNGTSHCMGSPTLTFSAPRIGLHARLSMPDQAETAAIVETSPVVNSNNGAFLYFHSGGIHRLAINGTGSVWQRNFSPGNLSSLTTVSLLAQMAVADTTTEQHRMWSNGAVPSGSGSSGAAITPVVNFNNHAVFVGARNNASLFAPIRLESLAIFNADTASTRSGIEACLNR